MIPIVTPEQMRAIDEAGPEPVEVLIDRAGWAVSRTALAMLGGGYGKRVLVLAGHGNNGADGRAAVDYLGRRGVVCTVLDVFGPEGTKDLAAVRASHYDLIIDACLGTGLSRPFSVPAEFHPGQTPVLAVDIPSGVDGLTGEATHGALAAKRTITFAALKPGLLLGLGAHWAGEIEVADIGLDCSNTQAHLLEAEDLAARWPRRPAEAHKWSNAVVVIAGRPGMTGAAVMATNAAMRAGSGLVGLAVPELNLATCSPGPVESIELRCGADWGRSLDVDGFSAAVVGPGLEIGPPNHRAVAEFRERMPVPTVFDASALRLLEEGVPFERGDARRVVLTPHDGEFEALMGERPGPDRIAAARHAASAMGAVVLLKGPTTVVARPDGRVLVSAVGDQRLATAGSGDVLSGVIAAGLAGGLDAFTAAGLGAELQGRAALLGFSRGLTAGDLPGLVARYRSTMV